MNSTIPAIAAALAAVLVIGAVTPSVYASGPIRHPRGDATTDNSDFEIKRAGITDTEKLRMVVQGEAGGTKPSKPSQQDLVYAYVFITDEGIVAVTSHRVEDSGQVDNDLAWHSHRVTLDGSGCVTSIEDFGRARLNGENLYVANTGASSINSVLTAELTVDGSDVCVSEVWDSAPN